jgi:hypothetical protein
VEKADGEANVAISDREFLCGGDSRASWPNFRSTAFDFNMALGDSHPAFNPEVRRKNYLLSPERNILLHSRNDRSGGMYLNLIKSRVPS